MAYINVLGAVYRQHRASMTKSKLEEMGQMWKNAAKIISSNLEKDISDHFLNNAEDWYNEYYKQKLDISSPTKESDSSNPNKISNTEPVLSDLYRENKEGTLFSIVIPVFNHYEYLVKCIQSIFNQSFTGYEVICVDDNSSDVRIMDLLRTLEQKHTFIKVIHNNHNLGIANTTNIGIEASTGKYVVFVDCDDFIESDALCIIMKSLRKNPEIDYFFTDRIDVDENDHYIRKSIYGGYKNITPSNDIKSDLLDGMVASHLKIIRKSKIKEVGGLDATLEGVQDYDLALKLVSKSKFKYIKKALYNHRIHKSSVTSTKSIHQIRNSNIARRRTCDEWYPKDHNVSELFTKILKEEDLNNDLLDLFCSNENVQFFTPRDYALKKLKEQVSRGKFCIFDLQNEILGEWGFFLRDYNSYFDLILTNDKKITAYLLGCLWDYRILKFTDVQKQ